MLEPRYIFLAEQRSCIALIDKDLAQVELIHHANSEKRLHIEGVFAQALLARLQDTTSQPSPLLQVIEKQHEWLQGLAQASLQPASLQQLVVGDDLGLLFLEITDQCNERCIHCYASSSPACHDFLSIDEIKVVLQQARALGQAFVQFTGGDPLIHRDLVEAVAYARALDFQDIEIYTNGLLLHAPLLEQLFPHNPMIAFSLYAADEAVHDSITQVEGSWKRTVAAIHRAQGMAFRVRIGMAVMQENAGHEQAMLDFVAETFALPPTPVRFDPVHQTGRGKSLQTQHITLQPSANSHMPPKIAQKHHQVVQTDVPQPSMDKVVLGRRGKFAICANGNVAPCIFNREHVLGNIRHAKVNTLQGILADADCNGNVKPSVQRWNHCQHNLSCSDCQMVAYTLGEKYE